jgi:hypothetical protein
VYVPFNRLVVFTLSIISCPFREAQASSCSIGGRDSGLPTAVIAGTFLGSVTSQIQDYEGVGGLSTISPLQGVVFGIAIKAARNRIRCVAAATSLTLLCFARRFISACSDLIFLSHCTLE